MVMRSLYKKYALFLGICTLFGGLFFLFGYDSQAQKQSMYATTPVSKGVIEDLVTATGIVNPRDYVDVGAQVSGQLSLLHVKVGDYVTKEALLAQIDTTVYKAKVDASRAQLRYQKAQLKAKESDLQLALIAYTRQKNLYERDATSLESLQTSQAHWHSSTASIEMIEAQIEQIESSLRADEANLEYARIYAPMSGTVVSITARQGQTLNANQQAPIILRIADLSTMTIRAEVSEADITKLRVGMEVYFKTLGSEFRWQSKLDKVEPTPTVTNNVVLYNALFDISNTTGKLMTYMTSQVFFINASAQDALLIPMSALRFKGKERHKASVHVKHEDGTLHERQVEVGVSNRVQAQIVSGLQEGEMVVASSMVKKESQKRESKSSLAKVN